MKKDSIRTPQSFMILAASIVIQMVLGRVYAWSNLGKALVNNYGYTSFQTETIFGLAIGIFAFSTIFSGKLVHKLGPKVLLFASALVYAGANLISLFFAPDFVALLIAFGPMMGIAIALGYVCPLSVAVQWFPNAKGLVTGLAVTGFGAGAILDSSLLQRFASSSADYINVSSYMGLVGSALIALSALVMRFPPTTVQVSTALHNPKPGLPDIRLPKGNFAGTVLYWMLGLAMFFGTAGGLIVIGKTVSIADEFNLGDYAAIALGLVAAGNALGRVAWGALMDRFGSKMLYWVFAVSTLSLFSMAFAIDNVWLFLPAIFFTGLQFGACLVVFATFCERYYGPGAIARVYPFIFVWYGLAALLAPPLGGVLHDFSSSYIPVVIVAALLPLSGLIFVFNGFRSLKGGTRPHAQPLS